MRLNKVIILAIGAVIFGGCGGDTQKTNTNSQVASSTISDPLVYDSKIVAELTHINQGLFGILEQINAADSVGITQQYYRTIQQLDEGIEKLNALPAMNDNTTYRDAALKIMKFHRGTMDNQYKRIIEISVKKKTTTREEEERETLYEQMENVEEKLDEQFFNIRDKFGKENNIKLPSGADLQL